MKTDKCEKLVCTLYGKKNHVCYTHSNSEASTGSWANTRTGP